jgi:hypothetical protein
MLLSTCRLSESYDALQLNKRSAQPSDRRLQSTTSLVPTIPLPLPLPVVDDDDLFQRRS